MSGQGLLIKIKRSTKTMGAPVLSRILIKAAVFFTAILFSSSFAVAGATAGEFKVGETYRTVPFAVSIKVLSDSEVELMPFAGQMQTVTYMVTDDGTVLFAADEGETTFAATVSEKGEFIVVHLKRRGGDEAFLPLFSTGAYETLVASGMVANVEDQMKEARRRSVAAELEANLRNAYNSAQMYIVENNPPGAVTVEEILSTGLVLSKNATFVSSDLSSFDGSIKIKVVIDGVGEMTGEMKSDGTFDISPLK